MMSLHTDRAIVMSNQLSDSMINRENCQLNWVQFGDIFWFRLERWSCCRILAQWIRLRSIVIIRQVWDRSEITGQKLSRKIFKSGLGRSELWSTEFWLWADVEYWYWHWHCTWGLDCIEFEETRADVHIIDLDKNVVRSTATRNDA